MLLPESFPLFYSLGLIVALSTTIFFWRFYVFRKNLLQIFKSIPSVIVLGTKGSGKSSFINVLTGSQVAPHPIQDFNVATLSFDGQKLQFIEIPHFVDAMDKLRKFKEINIVACVYVFDVSKSSEPIEIQLENFKMIKEFFKNLQFIVVANKIDEVDSDKMKKLEAEFEKIYKMSLNKSFLLQKDEMLKKELEDLSQIMLNLASEIKMQEEVR